MGRLIAALEALRHPKSKLKSKLSAFLTAGTELHCIQGISPAKLGRMVVLHCCVSS